MLFIANKYNIKINSGKILGEVEITGCIKVDEDFNKKIKQENTLVYHSNYTDKYAWKIENIKKYETLVEVKGKLSLWNY